MRRLLKYLVYPLLGWLDLALQLLIRPRPKRICYTSIPGYSDNSYYLYWHVLKQCSDVEHVWLLHDMNQGSRIRSEFERHLTQHPGQKHRLLIHPWHSFAGYWAFLLSSTAFHTHGMYVFSSHSRRRLRVGLWHGMPIKAIGRLNLITPNPKPTYATHYVASSHFFRYVLAAAFTVRPRQVLVCGQPRCDALTHASARTHQPQDVRQKLSLDEEQSLLVWLPTYRAENGANASRSFIDELEPALLQTFIDQAVAHNCVVIIKLHPMEMISLGHQFAGIPHVRVFSADEWQKTGIPLYDLLAAADALITDVSSVMIDFMLRKRPIGLFGFDPSRYTRELLFPLDYVLSSTLVSKLGSPAQLHGFFERVGTRSALKVSTNDVSKIMNLPPSDQSASETILQQLQGLGSNQKHKPAQFF